jgi:hypothetical protein
MAADYSRNLQYETWSSTKYQQQLEEESKANLSDELLSSSINVYKDFSATLSKDLQRIQFINNDNLRESAFKQAAMKDPGGILGVSKRSVAAKFAGSREITSGFTGELREMADEVLDALEVATGSDGGFYTYGSERDGTTIGNLVRQGISKITGSDEMRGFAPGTALYELVMNKDENWNEERKRAFVEEFINDDNRDMLAQIGVDEQMIKNTNSLGHALAGIIDRQTNRDAGSYFATAGAGAKTGFFFENMGRIMLADPDTAAEFGIALGAAAFTGGTSLVGFGARQLGKGAWVVSRSAARSKGLRNLFRATAPLSRARSGAQAAERGTALILKAGDKVHKLGFKSGKGLGKVAKVGTIAANLNPFAATENIIFPAIRDIKMVQRFMKPGARGAKTRADIALQREIKNLGAQGVAGRLMKDVFISTAPISFKAGVAANMLDGALGNLGAYAFSRDDEYAWAKTLYGDDATWNQYRGTMWGNEAQGGFLNSYAGSAFMGAGFGMVLGGAMRGLAVARYKAESLNTPDAGEAPPIARNPLQTLRKKIKDYNDYADGKTSNTHLGAMISGEKRKLVSMGEEQLTRGFIASAAARGITEGTDSKTLAARAKLIAIQAFEGGLDMNNFLRNITRKDGTIDMKEAAAYVRRHSEDPASKRRIKAREIHRRTAEAREIEASLHKFNVERLQRLLDSGEEWDTASHSKILDEIIEAQEEGSMMREVLTNYKAALNAENDNIVSAVMTALVGFSKAGASMTTAAKQRVVDRILEAHGLRDSEGGGVSLRVEDLESAAASKDRGEVRRRKTAELVEKKKKRIAELEATIEEMKAKAEKAEAEDGTTRALDAEDMAAKQRELTETKDRLVYLKKNLESSEKIVEENQRIVDDYEAEFEKTAQEMATLKVAIKKLEEDKPRGWNFKVKSLKNQIKKLKEESSDRAGLYEDTLKGAKKKIAEEEARINQVRNQIEESEQFVADTEAMFKEDAEAGTEKVDTSEEWAEATAELEAAKNDLELTEKVPDEVSSEDAGSIAIRESVEEAMGDKLMDERLRGDSEASTLSMGAAAAEIGGGAAGRVESTWDADESAAAMVVEELVKLDNSLEWDARNNSVRYTMDEMANRTRETAKRLLALLPAGSTRNRLKFDRRTVERRAKEMALAAFERERGERNKRLKKKDKKTNLTDMRSAIRNDFGVDTNPDGGTHVKGSNKLDDKQLTQLYADLSIAKIIDEQSTAVKTYIGKKIDAAAKEGKAVSVDPMLAVAFGRSQESINLISRHMAAFDRIRDGGEMTADGFVSMDTLLREFPEGEHNFIDVYAKGDTVIGEGNMYHLDSMVANAENRLRRAGREYEIAFDEGVARRVDGFTPEKTDLFQDMNIFANRVAQTNEFLARRADGVARHKDLHRSIIARRRAARSGESGVPELESLYLRRQKHEFAKGIFEGWRDAHTGNKRAIEGRLREMGLTSFTRQAGIWTEDAFDEAVHGEFGNMIWEGLKRKLGPARAAEMGKIASQWNGDRNSASGYQVGRALVEVLTNQSSTDKNIVPDITTVPTTGFKGRIRNDNYVRLYKQFYGEDVKRYVRSLGSHPEGEGPNRLMTETEITDTIAYYQDIANRLRGLKDGEAIPEDIEAVLSRVHYNVDKVSLAPRDVVKGILHDLKTVESVYKERVEMLEGLPPSVMTTLHDEFKFMRTAHAAVFGLGFVPDAKAALNPSLSGDAGFGGAAFTPGSAMSFVTLRTGQMFGTSDGLVEAASIYGMQNLSKFLKGRSSAEALMALEVDDAASIAKNSKALYENSRDASAQATTLGQAIARDYNMKYGDEATKALLDNPIKFKELLDETRTALYKLGGGEEMEARLKLGIEKYADETQMEGLYDNYSAAGREAISRLPEDSVWKRISDRMTETKVEEAAKGSDLPDDRVSPKFGGNPLADWARKKLFKPPVMTIVYSVGHRGVRGQIDTAIEELLENPSKFGIDDALASEIKANKAAMTQELATILVGKGDKTGAIADSLGLPSSGDLIKMMQSDDVTIVAGLTLSEKDLIEGTWKEDPKKAHVYATAMIKEAEELFGHADLGLGLWLMRLRVSKKDDTKNAIRMMQRTVDKGMGIAKKAAEKEGREPTRAEITAEVQKAWKPVSGFLKSVESANRVAYGVDGDIMSKYMDLAGAKEGDLSPDAMGALDGMAHFTENHAGAGRQVSLEHSTMAVRATDQEAIEEGAGSSIAQKRILESHDRVFGTTDGDEALIDLRRKNAVLKDMMFEYGAFIQPPGSNVVKDAVDFRPKNMDDFQRSILEYNADGRISSHKQRKAAAIQLKGKIKVLEDLQKEGKASQENLQELARLHVATKTFFAEGEITPERPDNIFNEQYGSGMFNSMYRAEALVDVGVDERSVSTMGIADLQVLDHTANNLEMQMIRQDREWTELAPEDKQTNAFSFQEVVTASPIAPTYVNAVRATRTHGDIGEEGVSPTDMAARLRNRRPGKSDNALAAENGADERLAAEGGVSVTTLRMDRLNRGNARQSNTDASVALRHKSLEHRKNAAKAARQSAKHRILTGFRNTFGYGAGEDPQKINMYKLDRHGRITRDRGVAKNNLEALQHFVLDNESVNHEGLLAGPVAQAGFFLSRWDESKNKYITTGEGPVSVAMAPLSVFARDYKLVGTAARDFPMVTAIRIAESKGVGIDKVIDDMNKYGFFEVHKNFIDTNYNGLKTEADQLNFEREGLEAAKIISDSRRVEKVMGGNNVGNKMIKKLNMARDLWLNELGAGEGVLDNVDWVKGQIEMIGTLDHLKANPDLFKRLKETMGQEFTMEQFAKQLAFGRDDLSRRVMAGDTSTPENISLVHPRTEGEKAKENTIDYVNGEHVVDHNIVPGKRGEVPLFTEDQIIHMLNLSANRQVVRNILTANMFGLELDPSKELDSLLRSSNDDFATGHAVHGFSNATKSKHDADRLQQLTDNEGLHVMADYGMNVVKKLGIKNVAPSDEAAYGLAKVLRENGLIVKGRSGMEISSEGMDVVKAFDLGFDNVTDTVEAVQLAADVMATRISDVWETNAKKLANEELAKKNAEIRERGGERPPDPDRAAEADSMPEDTTDYGDMDMLDIEERRRVDVRESPALDITVRESSDDSFASDRLGNAFLGMLEVRANNGSQAAENAASVFRALTGRDGTGDGMSSSEAMVHLELSFIDKDFRDALYGGDMVVESSGALGVDFHRRAGDRIKSRLRGLSRVKAALKDNGISASVYMLTHELVERLDVYHQLTTSASGGGKGQHLKGRMQQLFVENFGSKAARAKTRKILQELGVFDDKMADFFKKAEALDEGNVKKVRDINPEAERLNTEAKRKVKEEGDFSDREVLTEGFTQVLTMALMAKKGHKAGNGVLAKKFGGDLIDLAEALASKMHKVKDYVTRYGVSDDGKPGRTTRDSDASEVAGDYVGNETQLDSIISLMGTMARNVKHDKILRRKEGHIASRHWGGTGEETGPIADRSIGDVKLEIAEIERRMLTAGPRGRMAFQLELNKLKNEYFHMTNDPRHIMPPERVEEVWVNNSRDDGLVDARDLSAGDLDGYVNARVDQLLMNMVTKQSKGLGAAGNYVAGKFNSGQALAANNSEFDAIRGLWALANPESVNTQANHNKGWMPDQMAIDALATDKRQLMGIMNKIEKRMVELNSKDSPENAQARMRAIVEFFETDDVDARARILRDSGFPTKDLAEMEAAHKHLMDKESGFMVRLAHAMYETGQMGKRDYDNFRAKPKFPRSLKTEMVTPENQPHIREQLRGAVQSHLANTKSNGFRTDVAEMMGLYMDPLADASMRKLEFDAMPKGIKDMYVSIARKMPERLLPENFRDLSLAEQAFIGSEFHKKYMNTPSSERPDVTFNDTEWKMEYETAIRSDSPLAHTSSGGMTRQEKMFREVPRFRNKIGQDAYKPESLIDGLAHLEMLEMKQGTRMVPYRYAGDFDNIVTRSPDFGMYVDYNPQQTSIRLLSSNAPRAFAAMHQQHAIGVKGMSTLRVISNLRQRIESGVPMEQLGVSAENRTAFLQQLNTIEDAVRTGWDMAPRDASIATSGDRVINGLARGSVGFVSGGNFALSALAEAFATIPGTIGRMLTGDLMAPLDYVAAFSPKAREAAMREINGWETAKMQMGLRSRMGDMGLESMDEMLKRDSAPTALDRFENGSRTVQRMSMMGMRTLTEYSRTVATRQAIRKSIKAAGRNSFNRFGVEVKNLPEDATIKQVRAAARKAGMDPTLAVSLHQSGMADPALMLEVQGVIGNPRYFDEGGLKIDNFYREIGDEKIRAAVTHVLQFQNNKVNLDTRIGNKQIPKNVVESLIGALGQYPMLFYSRMRQGAWQGGAMMGTAAIILPLALGEIYYHTLSETAREGNTDGLKRWVEDPAGAMASVIAKMNLTGGFTPIQAWGTSTLVQTLRQGMDNPEFMSGYNTQTFGMSPINAAGLGMFVSGMRKMGSASAHMMKGEFAEGFQKAKDLGPFSYKQFWKGGLNALLQEEQGLGGILASDARENLGRKTRVPSPVMPRSSGPPRGAVEPSKAVEEALGPKSFKSPQGPSKPVQRKAPKGDSAAALDSGPGKVQMKDIFRK